MILAIMGTLVSILLATVNGFAEDGRWMLMSRHGECAEISILARKVPDMGTVTSPEQFVRVLQVKGFDVKRTDIPGVGVEVRVPELELSPIFVRYETCTAFDRKVPKD